MVRPQSPHRSAGFQPAQNRLKACSPKELSTIEKVGLPDDVEHGIATQARVMSVPLCLCGTPLVTDIEMGLWLCGHCGRAFCRDCGGMMARVGGCDTCTVCGMGMCG